MGLAGDRGAEGAPGGPALDVADLDRQAEVVLRARGDQQQVGPGPHLERADEDVAADLDVAVIGERQSGPRDLCGVPHADADGGPARAHRVDPQVVAPGGEPLREQEVPAVRPVVGLGDQLAGGVVEMGAHVGVAGRGELGELLAADRHRHVERRAHRARLPDGQLLGAHFHRVADAAVRARADGGELVAAGGELAGPGTAGGDRGEFRGLSARAVVEPGDLPFHLVGELDRGPGRRRQLERPQVGQARRVPVRLQPEALGAVLGPRGERQRMRPVAGEFARLGLAVEQHQGARVDRLRQEDQAVGAGGERALQVDDVAGPRERPAVGVLEAAGEAEAEAQGAQGVGAGRRALLRRDLQADDRGLAGGQREVPGDARPQHAAVDERRAVEGEAEVAAGGAEGLDGHLVVPLAQVLLEEEVAADAVHLLAAHARHGAGAQGAGGGEEAGRADGVEAGLAGAHQIGRVLRRAEVEVARRAGREGRELRHAGERGGGERRQRRRGAQGVGLDSQRVVDGLLAVIAHRHLVLAGQDRRLGHPGAAVDRDREARAVLGLGAERAPLDGADGDLEQLARPLRHRQGRREIDGPGADHPAGGHPRLAVGVGGVEPIRLQVERREARRRPHRLRLHGERLPLLARRPQGELDDPLAHRLEGEDVEAGIERPGRARPLEVGRLVALRPGEEERFDPRPRRGAARRHAVAAGLLDLEEEGGGGEQVETPLPRGVAVERDGGGGEEALGLVRRRLGHQHGGVDRVRGGAGMDG